MQHRTRTGILAVVALIAAVSTAQGQGLGDRLKKRAGEAAKRTVEQRVDQKSTEATNAALDKAENTVKCAATDKACQDKAKADGKSVVIDDSAPKGGASATPAPATSSNGATAGSPSTPSGSPASSMKPGEGAWVNYDFVPGSRALYVDDFSKDNVGDFPRRLEFLEGNMEVAEWQGARYLRVTSWPGRFAIPLTAALPERFTLEFDVTPPHGNNWLIMRFADHATDDVRFRVYGGKGMGGVFGASHQAQGSTPSALPEGASFRGRIMADGKYVKVYINDTRVANIPNADLGRSNKITVEVPGKEDMPTMLSNLSVMAGGKKLYDALAESGRVATQGIYFDTGSDRIRPESTPTLKEIAAMLNDHSDLKLTIEGHTDNVGSATSNQALSEKRAAAVRQFLIDNYSVDAARLTAKGLGSTKPAGSNDTPEGRQTNRRVELVKVQ
jgi:outer membrane protein OmpA-like peptidoglycan-associated protein